MGNIVNHGVYNLDVDKNKVQEYWDEVARREDWQEGCSGLPGSIRWVNNMLDSREEAEKWIEENDRGWYDQVAVKFKHVDEAKLQKIKAEDTKRKELLKKWEETCSKKNELDNKKHYEEVSSEYVGCKKCGSRINRVKLLSTAMVKNGNFCPVCREDLRPESTLKRIKAYDDKAEKLLGDLREYDKKLEAKLAKKEGENIKWLVKTEYHV